MSSISTEWILKLKDDIVGPLKGVDDQAKKTNIDLKAIAESAKDLEEKFNKAIAPGIAFESSLSDVEAITGVTGEALDSLGRKARKSSKRFGTEASGVLNNYKTLLSKLGPDIGKNQEALDAMSNSGLILSKTMDNDVPGAINAATTAMLQFRVDLNDPIAAAAEMDRMINVMAAGAKEGSAEVPQIAAAIRVAGVEASKSNVSFVETNAAIQELARGGKEGAEGGVALRNILGKIAGEDVIPKEALEKLQRYGVDMKVVSDTSLPFTTRLRELGKAQSDATVFAQVFGTENAAAANILVRSVNEQDSLQQKIRGTNVAYEQAEIKMATHLEKQKRVTAWMQNMGISLFNVTKDFIPFIQVGFGAVQVLAHVKNMGDGAKMVMSSLRKTLRFVTAGFKKAAVTSFNFGKSLLRSGLNALKASGRFIIAALQGIGSFIVSMITATAATWGFNIALSANPIGLIIIGIVAVIAAIVALVKYWDVIKAAIAKFAAWVFKNNPFRFLINLIDRIFPGFKAKLQSMFDWVKNLVLKVWEKIKALWQGIKSFFGFGSDDKAEVNVSGEVKVNDNTEQTTDPEANDGGLFNAAGSSSASSKVGEFSNTSDGKGKIINMTLNITNTFSVTGDKLRNNVDDLVEQVTRKINDRLRDAIIVNG